MVTKVKLTGIDLTIEQVYEWATSSDKEIEISLDEDALKRMQVSRDYVHKIVSDGKPVYGINTGFGALSDKFIDKENLAELQVNLIRSHCTGVGKPFNRTISRAIMILRANCLASGFSGINPELVVLLLDLINHGVTPVIPEKGSVGASGDLAPLSHIAITLIGEGKVLYKGELIPSKKALDKIGKKSVILGPKDGLALINGTAVMAGLGAIAIYESTRLMKLADILATLTLDSLRGSMKAYDEDIARLKPHPGQIRVAANLNKLLKGSEIIGSHENCGKVQDPYSLRCVPQVHGSCRQTLSHAKEVVDIELNSVTDNPLIFPEQNKVISGGNFHGEALAFCMDYLSMGLSELCSISERRVEKMMNPTFSDLPAFLTKDSGLNSGLMIAHVTAAALTSENKYLCHPASVDSIPTSTDKEDHVSMGVTSGRKLHEVLENTKHCLAIELLCNTQALDLGRPLRSSKALEAVHDLVRVKVPFIDVDRMLSTDIENLVELIDSFKIVETVEKIIGELD
ncbi:MAG: histidine ammonia-lyase [Epsilonproteobacteria bacterium]|nr:MAG: histidine ammonia-lyase [Campylobacterota bacterium]RLA67573.1 MAG: histidine ammonia-lyase [Campylobacterota bacterium]